jgi:hypothetical protein
MFQDVVSKELLNDFPETKGYTRRVGSGRKRSTIARDNHFLTLTILRNKDTTAVRARNELQEVRGMQ